MIIVWEVVSVLLGIDELEGENLGNGLLNEKFFDLDGVVKEREKDGV